MDHDPNPGDVNSDCKITIETLTRQYYSYQETIE